jgi:Uma2 family endonuclease
MARIPLAEEQAAGHCLVLNVETLGLSDEQFFELCLDNPELHLELTAQKELVIMTLPGGKTGRRNITICTNLDNWARQNGTGVSFAPLTLFVLPNGAKRAPDASWVSLERWNALTDKQQESAPPLCPDFVAELVSPSDRKRLKFLQAKMAEYIENGAQLGWLIDPFKRNVYIYRANERVQRLGNPTAITADPVLPGFALELSEIWSGTEK